MDMSTLAALAAQAAAAQQMTALQNSALFPMQMQAFQGMPHPAAAAFVANAAQTVQAAQANQAAQFTQQVGFANPMQAAFANPMQAGFANPTQAVSGMARIEREAPPSDNLYMTGLPANANEEFIRGVFGQSVVQCRVLPSRGNDPGGAVALVRFSSVDEATNVRRSMDGLVLPGSDKSIQIRFNKNNANNNSAVSPDNLGFGKGMGKTARVAPYNSQYNSDGRQPNETLYVTGLPATVDADWLQHKFGPHGPVRDMKLLPQKGENRITRSALIRYDSVDQSSAAKTAIHGTVAPGCDGPILVEFSRPHMSMDPHGEPEATKRMISPDMNAAEMDQQTVKKLLASMESGRTGYPASWYWPKNQNSAAAFDHSLNKIDSTTALPGAHAIKDVCAMQGGGLPPGGDDLQLKLLAPSDGNASQDTVACNAGESCKEVADLTSTEDLPAASASEMPEGPVLSDGQNAHEEPLSSMVQQSSDNQINSNEDTLDTKACERSAEEPTGQE